MTKRAPAARTPQLKALGHIARNIMSGQHAMVEVVGKQHQEDRRKLKKLQIRKALSEQNEKVQRESMK